MKIPDEKNAYSLNSRIGSSYSVGHEQSFRRTVKIYFYNVLIVGVSSDKVGFISSGIDKIIADQSLGNTTAIYQSGNKAGLNLGFIKRHSIEEVYTFLFFRGKLEVGDQPIVNISTFAMEPLDKRLVLANDEGLGRFVIGAYDFRHNIFALQSSRVPNKSDFEVYLSNRVGRAVRLSFIVDVNADRYLNKWTLKNFLCKSLFHRLKIKRQYFLILMSIKLQKNQI